MQRGPSGRAGKPREEQAFERLAIFPPRQVSKETCAASATGGHQYSDKWPPMVLSTLVRHHEFNLGRLRSPCAGPRRSPGPSDTESLRRTRPRSVPRSAARCGAACAELPRSAGSQAPTVFLYASIRGEVRTGRRRGVGTGEARASRTRRRWTPYFRDKARIDICCCQLPAGSGRTALAWTKASTAPPLPETTGTVSPQASGWDHFAPSPPVNAPARHTVWGRLTPTCWGR